MVIKNEVSSEWDTEDVFSLLKEDLTNVDHCIDPYDHYWNYITPNLLDPFTSDSLHSNPTSELSDMASNTSTGHQSSNESKEDVSNKDDSGFAWEVVPSEAISYINFGPTISKIVLQDTSESSSYELPECSRAPMKEKKRRGRPPITDPKVKFANKKKSQIKAAKNYRFKIKRSANKVEEEAKELTLKNDRLKIQYAKMHTEAQHLMAQCSAFTDLKAKEKRNLKKCIREINSLQL